MDEDCKFVILIMFGKKGKGESRNRVRNWKEIIFSKTRKFEPLIQELFTLNTKRVSNF